MSSLDINVFPPINYDQAAYHNGRIKFTNENINETILMGPSI